MTNLAKLISSAAIYVPEDSEGIRISYTVIEEQYFIGYGEDSGEEYKVNFDEVNLETDMFYELKLMNPADY